MIGTYADTVGIPVDAAVFLYVGRTVRTHPFKDFGTVRDAVARIAELEPDRDVWLLVLGEGAVAERAGAASIRYLGNQTPAAVARHYQAADVYLHAAVAETFPLVILEAMVCGLPSWQPGSVESRSRCPTARPVFWLSRETRRRWHVSPWG